MGNPFPEIVKDSDYEKWLEQFDKGDQEYIEKLLPYFQYFSSEKVFELLNVLYNKLVSEYNIETATTLFVPVGYISKSGAAITYFFRRENDLDEANFIAMNDFTPEIFRGIKSVVFLDDFIGTGDYLNSIKKDFVQKLPDSIAKRVNFICGCVVGYQQGIENVADETFKVCVAHLISYETQPLNPKATIFSKEEQTIIRNILLRYNERLNPTKPLGYGNIQGLVSFFFATPNNTLPMFWSSKNDWYPLFPRGDSRRNPNRIIVLPDFLQEHKIFSTDFNSKIKYSENTTRALFDSFLSLDKMNIMAEIFSHLNFDDNLIVAILNAIDSYQNLQHEKNSICTSIFIIDSKCEPIVKNELIADATGLSINDKNNFRKHLQVVDGWSNTLVVNNSGNALGILNYKPNGQDVILSRATDKYKAFEATSSFYHGLLIVFTNDNRVLIYYNGNRLMTKKGKDWHIQGNLRNISEIALSHNILPSVLDKAIQLAFKLSDMQEGGLLGIGDEENTVKYASSMGNLQFEFREKNILKTDEKSLLSLSAQDGAILVTSSGNIIRSMVRLEPPNSVQVNAEDDKGTRHNTAKKMSAVTNAVFITISSDGPISIYVGGDRIMRMLG